MTMLYQNIKRKQGKEILKQEKRGDVEYLTFPGLAETGMVNHLFSTRIGGVSKGIYGTMNVSYTRGDKKEAVDENFRRIAAVFGREAKDIVCSDQTHTTNIRLVTEEDKGKGIVREKNYHDIDGLITNVPGIIFYQFHLIINMFGF